MGSKERRLSYSIAFKIEVVNYAEKHGNRAAERRFGSPQTEMMILVAVTTIFWVSMTNKLYYGC